MSDVSEMVITHPALVARMAGFKERGMIARDLPYESFVCSQADAFVRAFSSLSAFEEAWGKYKESGYKFEVMAAFVPEFSDDITGNQMSRIVHYIRTILTLSPEVALLTLPRMHASICPFLSCEDSCCWAASAEAKKLRAAESLS